MPSTCQLLLGAFFVLPVAWGVFYTCGSESTAQPRARIDRCEYNFGSVSIGTELAATFRVTNDGARRLILTKQGTCCGAALETIIIPPRETQDFVIPIHTSQLQPGPVRESVVYETNDPLNPILKLTVLLDVETP